VNEKVLSRCHVTRPVENQYTDCAAPHLVPSDQPAIAASNRGNKLKEGAKYIHEGSLTYANGAEVYKEVRACKASRD
jgi:RXT2-like, N-terminal